jgi:putative oxidoreductase
MTETRTSYAALILRVALGIFFLLHVWLKVVVFTPEGTVKFFESVGLPGTLAYIVIAWEACVGVALILGIWTSIAALVIIPDLLGAIFWVHGSAGFFFSNPNGGWEFIALWIVALVVLAILGDGAYALRPLNLFGEQSLAKKVFGVS